MSCLLGKCLFLFLRIRGKSLIIPLDLKSISIYIYIYILYIWGFFSNIFMEMQSSQEMINTYDTLKWAKFSHAFDI